MFPENLWFALEQDLATLTQHCQEDGGHRQNSSETKANTYFYLSQAPWPTLKDLARRLVRHSWKLYSTMRMPLTGPLQNGRHSDLTSIFTWQSKHQKVPLQTWSLWPAAMWATRGMHKHSPSKQPSHKVHGTEHLDLCPSKPFKPVSIPFQVTSQANQVTDGECPKNINWTSHTRVYYYILPSRSWGGGLKIKHCFFLFFSTL